MDTALALIPSILLALLSWYLAWAGRRDRLPRNAIIGIRTRSTTRSDAAWFAAHRAAATYNVGAGIWFAIGGLAAGLIASDESRRLVFVISAWAIAFVQVAIAVVVAVRAAKGVEPDAEVQEPTM